jgi:hypothetical protein
VASPSLAVLRVDVPALSRALRDEARLLELLRDVLDRQRDAVGRDDLEAVDASVFDAQRVLLSLNQARQRRRNLMMLASGEENMHLSRLPEVLGAGATPELHEALDHVLAVAAKVAREMELNRRILNGAISAGHELLRAIGQPGSAPVYGATPAPPSGRPANLILNRQV